MQKPTGFAADCEAMRQRALSPVVMVTERAIAPRRFLKFDQPHCLLVAVRPEKVQDCLQKADEALAQGYYVAGYLSYEAALGLDHAFETSRDYVMPLLWLGVFSAPAWTDGPEPHALSPGLQWQREFTPEEYRAAIGSIRSQIAAGSTYQANFTFRLWSSYAGDPWQLFCYLFHNQPSTCCMYIDTGRWSICSASPELFFALDGSTLTVRPMKGTLRRGRWLDEDERLVRQLYLSEKDRAENLMIVDMMRNDLGRVCDVGSVQVPQLFEVERHPTVLQMTSTVTGSTSAPFSRIVSALFPCASITGAPKVETMRILAHTERSPREVYTGSMGYITPARQARFNVAIRTVIVDKETGAAQCGVGSGITWDSTSEQEYQECLLKSRFTVQDHLSFQLLETSRWDPQAGFVLLGLHLARLEQSARFLNFRSNRHFVLARLEAAIRNFGRVPMKVRLLLSATGELSVDAVPLESDPLPVPALVRLAGSAVDRRDAKLFHKTTNRELYLRLLDSAPDCYDLILWNREAFVTELTRFNVLAWMNGRWTTPPVEHGLLCGTLRQELLRADLVEEADLTKDRLATAQALAAVNSVRGLLRLRPLNDDSWLLEPIPEGLDRDAVFKPLMHHLDQVMGRHGSPFSKLSLTSGPSLPGGDHHIRQ
jgi:para-aminobenzoate synthetase/4-amino-4-deoxychorismate lyase